MGMDNNYQPTNCERKRIIMKTQDENDDEIMKEWEDMLQRRRYAGNSPRETAAILLTGRGKFENPAFSKAKEYGDAIIPALQEVSENFAHLNELNALLIAEVLAAIDTPLSLHTCRELYASDIELHQLVGAVGFAEHGAIGDLEKDFRIPIETLSRVKEQVNWEIDTIFQHDSPGLELRLQLAILALGNTRNGQAIPCLSRILRINTIQSTPNTSHIHAWICEAIQKIGDRRAIPMLSERMVDPRFHAAEYAFNALYSLSPQEAIPVTIQRIRTEVIDHRFELWGPLVQKLEAATHQHFYDDYEAWQTWWEKQKRTWEAIT
jgi:hypothetical protein